MPQPGWDAFAQLCTYLSVEAFLVADHLDGDVVVLLVVVGLDHLPEAALAYHLQYLVPVCQVVVYNVSIRALQETKRFF